MQRTANRSFMVRKDHISNKTEMVSKNGENECRLFKDIHIHIPIYIL